MNKLGFATLALVCLLPLAGSSQAQIPGPLSFYQQELGHHQVTTQLSLEQIPERHADESVEEHALRVTELLLIDNGYLLPPEACQAASAPWDKTPLTKTPIWACGTLTSSVTISGPGISVTITVTGPGGSGPTVHTTVVLSQGIIWSEPMDIDLRWVQVTQVRIINGY